MDILLKLKFLPQNFINNFTKTKNYQMKAIVNLSIAIMVFIASWFFQSYIIGLVVQYTAIDFQNDNKTNVEGQTIFLSGVVEPTRQLKFFTSNIAAPKYSVIIQEIYQTCNETSQTWETVLEYRIQKPTISLNGFVLNWRDFDNEIPLEHFILKEKDYDDYKTSLNARNGFLYFTDGYFYQFTPETLKSTPKSELYPQKFGKWDRTFYCRIGDNRTRLEYGQISTISVTGVARSKIITPMKPFSKILVLFQESTLADFVKIKC